MLKLPRLLLLSFWLVVLQVLFMGAIRLAFWAYFDNPNAPLPLAELFTAMYIGGKFDLRLALLLLLPLLVLGGLRWFDPFRHRGWYLFWLGYLTLCFVTVIVFQIFNFGYYSYLNKPLDATILRFAEDFAISMEMLWQTYPVVGLFLLIIAGIALFGFILHKFLQYFSRQPIFQNSRKKTTTLVVVTGLLVLFGIYGKFSYYPLRWSDAFTSTHSFAPPVTLNPVLYFFETIKNREISYSEEATRQYYDLMADYLGVEQPDKQALYYKRHITKPGPLADKQPNIILVYLESFAAYKTGIFGNPLNPTPHFDALARNGLFFRNYYTPHTGTARSVFSGITGIPDVELNRTSSRNPLIVDQHTLINAFPGYEKFYFLGGSANWGNIRGLLSHNIPNLQIYEEGSYTAERVDVWGISDLHLFEEANQVLRQQTKPFFAIIQTAGNHRPYTIPADNRGLVLDNRPDESLTQHGFISNAEYNSFRYMDHSIGHFIQQVRQEAYFDNTIFVFFGDHGISGYGGQHTPAFESHFDLTSFHVPFVIYAPGLLPPREYDKVASHVDLLPTLAGLAAPGYTATTLGRDLLDPRFDEQAYAFIISHDSVPRIGVISRKHLFRMRADGSQRGLYAIDGENYQQDITAQQPEVGQQLETLTQALYETARYMRYHNPNALTKH